MFVILLVFCLCFLFVFWNISPFMRKDIWGHYLRSERRIYVYRDKSTEKEIRLLTKEDEEIIKEPVNPWLEWWHLAKHKPNTVIYEYENEEVEKLWKLVNGK